MNMALINIETSKVVNRIFVGDGYEPPEGFMILPSEIAEEGWDFDKVTGTIVVPPASLPTREQLMNVVWLEATRRANAGYSFNVGTKDTPLIAYADTNTKGEVDLQRLVRLNVPAVWVQSPEPIKLTVDQIKALGTAVDTYLAEIYSAAFTILADTTVVDSPQVWNHSAWPSNSG